MQDIIVSAFGAQPFTALARVAARCVGDFSVHDSAVRAPGAPLFTALAVGAGRRVGVLSPQDSADTAWVIETAYLPEAQMVLTALAALLRV